MRLRTHKWVWGELAESYICIDDPQSTRGKWQTCFEKEQPMCLELGCGKGGFISQIAPQNPDINWLAVDIKSEMLGQAKRKIEAAYTGNVPNVRICSWDIERIDLILAPWEKVERIYINFCNPWPKPKQHKKRLTHPRQLQHYKEFLKPGGEIHFKTDDKGLFEASLRYFAECNFQVIHKTYDLHQDDYSPNYVTEHEIMFTNQGLPTMLAVAKWEE